MRRVELQCWSLLSQWQDWGNGLELHQEWLRLGVRKMFFTRGWWGPRTGSQGSGHSSNWWRSRSIWPVLQALGLDLGVLCGPGSWTRWFFVVPFQIIGIWFSIFYRIFYDTMILRLSVNFFIVIIYFFFAQATVSRRAHLNPADEFQGDKIYEIFSLFHLVKYFLY